MPLTDDIKSRMSFIDLFSELKGESLQLGKATTCFDHDDHNASMAIYADGAYCFVCCKQFDIFDVWQHYQKVDFLTALDELALRAGLQTSRKNKKQLQQQRIRENALEVVASFYERRLWSDEGKICLEYARSRGWLDTTIKRARLGFAASDQELRKRLLKAGVSAKGVISSSGLDFCSLRDGYKLSPQGYLVYPHIKGVRVQYFAARSIEGKTHRNLPGKKQLYYNWLYHPKAKEFYIVEGQADAISLGQWDRAAIGECGASLKEAIK